MIFKNPLSSFTGVTETELKSRLKRLTNKELKYFKFMMSRYGVLYITGKPGIAKSAIIKSIADKLEFNFIEIRLSMVDETDVGLFPKLGNVTVNGIEWDVLSHVPPEWAHIANEKPSIIFFDEFNRSTLPVRNASLQILLERKIGYKFAFNKNVLMAAAGNLGEEDGTDVDELDEALKNRLIHVSHDLSMKEWIDDFAREHVHPSIINFIINNADHYYKTNGSKNSTEGEGKGQKLAAYATPRSWTMLSEYINSNYPPYQETNKDGELIFVDSKNKIVKYTVENSGDDITYLNEKGVELIVDSTNFKPKYVFAPMKDWINDVKEAGISYVGASITRFVKYCEESIRLSINDVINRFNEIKSDLAKFNRDKHSELIKALKEIELYELTDKQIENVKLFLMTIQEDELTGYLLFILDEKFDINADQANKQTANLNSFIKDSRFKKHWKTILSHCESDDDTDKKSATV